MFEKYRMVHLVIIAQIMSYYITEGMALKFLHGPFLNYVVNFRKKLIALEKTHFEKCITDEEKYTVDLYDSMDRFLKVIAQVPIYEMDDIVVLIEANRIDEKSMQGIAKKVIKHYNS
jgi:hypothetical protein